MKESRVTQKGFLFFMERLEHFGRNSNVHGLKYVFQENGTTLTRTVWLIILLIFTGCLYLLLEPVVGRGGTVSFTSDTRYLNWTTTFPAVTVCEKYTPKSTLKGLLEKYPDLMKPLNFDYRRYVADLVYGRGTCSKSLCLPCGDPVPCDVPWRDIIETVHKKCNEIITGCSFHGEDFSCCNHFHTVDSEYGACFSFNSLQGAYDGYSQFVVNRSSGPGTLSFRLHADAYISVHSSEDLSTNVLDKKFRFEVKTSTDSRVDYLFSIVEVDSEPILRNEDISVRKCRYKDELPEGLLHTYKTYSYGACRLAQSTTRSYERCGCVFPVRDLSYRDLYCNYTGMNCIVTYEVQKSKLGLNNNTGIEDCLPSCEESELSRIHLSKRRLSQEVNYGSLVNVKMVYLPTMRYQKSLLRTNLDFVVTVGGMVGLFFSASILSLAEVFYLILRSDNK